MRIEDYFLKCRKSVFDMNNNILLSKIASSDQEKDLTVPPNCNGYGRIRHFRRFISEEWERIHYPLILHAELWDWSNVI